MRVRLEGCSIARSGEDGVSIFRKSIVEVTACRIHDSVRAGLYLASGENTCRIEGCEIWGNGCGVFVRDQNEALLVGNTIRDHARGDEGNQSSGAGLFVTRSGAGCATVRPDNVFARNAGGDVVREEEEEEEEEEE